MSATDGQVAEINRITCFFCGYDLGKGSKAILCPECGGAKEVSTRSWLLAFASRKYLRILQLAVVARTTLILSLVIALAGSSWLPNQQLDGWIIFITILSHQFSGGTSWLAAVGAPPDCLSWGCRILAMLLATALLGLAGILPAIVYNLPSALGEIGFCFVLARLQSRICKSSLTAWLLAIGIITLACRILVEFGPLHGWLAVVVIVGLTTAFMAQIVGAIVIALRLGSILKRTPKP